MVWLLVQDLELVEKVNGIQFNFPFGYSGWEFWTTSQDVPFILEIFRSDKPKWPYHLQSNRNFRNFFVNGKHSKPWTSNFLISRSKVCSRVHALTTTPPTLPENSSSSINFGINGTLAFHECVFKTLKSQGLKSHFLRISRIERHSRKIQFFFILPKNPFG